MKLTMQQPMAPANEAAAPEKVLEQGAVAAAARPAESFAANNVGTMQSADQAKAADALSKFAEATATPSSLASTTKDFTSALVDPVLVVMNAVLALHFDIMRVSLSHIRRSNAARNFVNVDVCWHRIT